MDIDLLSAALGVVATAVVVVLVTRSISARHITETKAERAAASAQAGRAHGLAGGRDHHDDLTDGP